MNKENKKTHYLKTDYRIESLKTIIEGLTKSIGLPGNKKQDNSWYDSTWFLEDLEPILGISLIALQNYINGSIKDFSDTTNNKTRFFKFSPTINGFENQVLN
ncbi:MAG: hypothetical protein IPH45_21525 [Bacteroidales bacterium]|nr:hypothetical protein [Bacteroidales bacterium]